MDIDHLMPVLEAGFLKWVASELLLRSGATVEESEYVAKCLVESDLCGHETHGLMRLNQYVKLLREGKVKSGAKPRVVRETPSTAVVDGGWGFGQITARDSMNLAISKAREVGVGITAAYNCNHAGRLGEYSKIALDHDMIGIVICNDRPGVAPYGSIDPLMGTNPVSIAIPAGRMRPIILDMATSVVSGGRVRLARLRGEKIPLGWIIDKDGKPSTDPADLHGPTGVIGALLPFGGYKGSGLAIAIEILAGGLSGSGCSHETVGPGLLTAALDIRSFTPVEVFKERVDRFIEAIKNSRKAPGFKEILLPGERAQRLREKRLREGIPLDEKVWEDIKKTARELGINLE